jgi:hypothetical protein
VARCPAHEVAELLLTADRFATRPSPVPVPVPAPERAALLERLGLFGVRLAVELIRSGEAPNSPELCRRLAATSGLDRLRDVVLTQFESRARVLKARSAVTTLDAVLRRDACRDGPDLLRRLEQITSGAHEFEEVRILLDLRAGDLTLPTARESELDLLMGGAGHDPASRLGLDLGAEPEQVRQAALEALRTWRGVERHPLSSRATQIAASAATRTIEGFLAAAG